MIDTHVHVHDKAYDEDRDEVVARARVAGVDGMVCVGCDLADSARALETARKYGFLASVGVHPHEAKDAPDDLAAAFAPFLADERVVAIGETGLDYFYDHSPRDVQVNVARKQLRLARKHRLPVIFHQRDAFDDFLTLLRDEFTPGMRGVVHCFTGTPAQARTFIEEFGLFLGIGGVLTFKNAERLRDAARLVGVTNLLLETDAPYLAPIPHRGQRNEPAFVGRTATMLAEILNLPLANVVTRTTENARTLFQRPSGL